MLVVLLGAVAWAVFSGSSLGIGTAGVGALVNAIVGGGLLKFRSSVSKEEQAANEQVLEFLESDNKSGHSRSDNETGRPAFSKT